MDKTSQNQPEVYGPRIGFKSILLLDDILLKDTIVEKRGDIL